MAESSSIAVLDPKYPTESLIFSSSNDKPKRIKVQKFCHYLESLIPCSRPLEGDGPLLYGCGYCVSRKERCLYVYGGTSSSKFTDFGGLHRLDFKTFKWDKLSTPSVHHSSPVEKGGCGLLYFGGMVIVIGGYGRVRERQFGWTNEVNAFSIKKRTWVRVKCRHHSELPPLSFFTLTMISTNCALLFGGKTKAVDQERKTDSSGSDECSNQLYLLECKVQSSLQSEETVTIQIAKLDHSNAECPGPQGRFNHTAACLEFDSNSPKLVISGGENIVNVTLHDIWIFDVASQQWIQIEADSPPRQRHLCMAATLWLGVTSVVVFATDKKQANKATIITIDIEQKSPNEYPHRSIERSKSFSSQLDGVDLEHSSMEGSTLSSDSDLGIIRACQDPWNILSVENVDITCTTGAQMNQERRMREKFERISRRLKEVHKKFEKARSLHQDYEEEMKKFRNSNEQLKIELKQAEEEIAMMSSFDEIKSDLNEENAPEETVKDEASDLEASLTIKETTDSETTEPHKESEKQASSLKQKLKAMKEDMNRLLKEKKDQDQEFKEEKSKLESKIDEQKQTFEEEKSKLVSEMHEQKQSYEEKVDRLVKKKNAQQRKYKDDVDRLEKDKKRSLEDKMARIVEDKRTLQQTFEDDIARLEKEKNDQKRSLEEEKMILMIEKNEQKRNFEDDIARLKKENGDHKRSLDSLKSAISSLEKENGDLRQTLREVQDNFRVKEIVLRAGNTIAGYAKYLKTVQSRNQQSCLMLFTILLVIGVVLASQILLLLTQRV